MFHPICVWMFFPGSSFTRNRHLSPSVCFVTGSKYIQRFFFGTVSAWWRWLLVYEPKHLAVTSRNITKQSVLFVCYSPYINPFSSLSYDRSKASSKASSPHSAIQSFLLQMRVPSPSLTLRLLMSYIYGAPILDVSRSHTTTHHSR